MDPAFFAVGGTLIGGVFIKLVEEWLTRGKEAGSIAISASDDYERRWEDPDYVDMIHTTRRSEQDLFDEIYTECLCADCKRFAIASSMVKTHNESRIELPTYHHTHYVDGYAFRLPTNQVPAHATGYWNPSVQYATFVWYDQSTGAKSILKAFPTEYEFEEVYSGAYEHPVKRIAYEKPSKILKPKYHSDHGPKNHMVFTASGPKMVSKSYLDNYVPAYNHYNSGPKRKHIVCDMCGVSRLIAGDLSRTTCIPCKREYQLKLQKETDDSLARAVANRDIVVMK